MTMIQMTEGRYRVQVTEQVFGENENGKLCLSFEVTPVEFLETDGIEPGWVEMPQAGDSRTIAFFFVSEQNTQISIRELRKLGYTGESFTDFIANGNGIAPFNLVGQVLVADCRYEEYTTSRGETRQGERWSFVTSKTALSERLAAIAKPTALELDAKFAAILKKTKTPTAAAPKTPAAPVPPTPPPAPKKRKKKEEEEVIIPF
jgi:hypothetical protein